MTEQEMLTRAQMHQAAGERIHEVAKEFTRGFQFLERFPRSVTFFGSSMTKEGEPTYEDARSLAYKISKDLGYSIVSGGGPGIMEAANRGAHDAEGVSIGMTIRLPREQVTNPYINEHINFYYFFARKVCLTYSSEAFIFYPGGFGTYDELFELLTLIQTKKIEGVPLILVGSDYWKKFFSFARDAMLSQGTIDEEDLSLFTITDSHDEIIEIIKSTPVRAWIPWNGIHGTPHSALVTKHCEPCEGGVFPMKKEESARYMDSLDQWVLIEDTRIEKTYTFHNFQKALYFVDGVGALAEAEGHHPDIEIFGWNKVKITLTTHSIGGLSENDFIMASKIDALIVH